MRLGDLDALSAFVGDLRSTLHKEQSTFKAMKQSEFEIKDNMLLNFQYAIDNAPTVVAENATTERPTGEWIKDEQGIDRCSKCFHKCTEFVMGKPKDNFCIECGADMRKGGAE